VHQNLARRHSVTARMKRMRRMRGMRKMRGEKDIPNNIQGAMG
jgi:hypothetical protein